VPIAANRRIAESFREADLLAPPAFVRLVQRRDPQGSFRILGESFYRAPSARERATTGSDPGQVQLSARNYDGYAHALWGVGTVFNNDFDHGDLSRFDSLRKISFAAAPYRDSQSFWSTYALRFGVRYPDQDPVAGFGAVGGDALQVWDVNAAALPDIRMAAPWREVDSALVAGERIARIAPGEVLVETGERFVGDGGGTARVRVRLPERLEIETGARNPGYLFVLRGYWPYRRVAVDGQPVECFPAQVAFSAVRIPAGRHTVSWEERLPGTPASWGGPLLFLAVAGLLLARQRRTA
jgi:hypothetical protein